MQAVEKMTGEKSGNLDEILALLWKNWAFRLSLSSNELFHSNTLQYLAELLSAQELPTSPLPRSEAEIDDAEEDGTLSSVDSQNVIPEPTVISGYAAKQLLLVMGALENDPKYRACFEKLNFKQSTFIVEREWNDLDLVVLARDGNAKRPIFALEVKVKAYPTGEQLHKYQEKLKKPWTIPAKGCDYSPPLFLLTGMGADIVDMQDVPITSLCFEKLSKNLNAAFQNNDCLRTHPVVTSYIDLCGQLDRLFAYLKSCLVDRLSIQNAQDLGNKLEPFRLHSIWWKLWASFIARKCYDEISKQIKPEENQQFLHTYSGFSRTGNLGICWKWQDKEKSPDELIAIGVQLEGNSFRLYLEMKHSSLGTKAVARTVVERILLQLCEKDGVFADNPVLGEYVTHWTNQDESESNKLRNQVNISASVKASAGQSSPKPIFIPVPSFGKSKKEWLARLPGFANGNQHGFADFRLQLQPDAEISGITKLIREILIDDKFSKVSSTNASSSGQTDALLLRVVKSFQCQPSKYDWVDINSPRIT